MIYSVHVLPSASTSTQAAREIAQSGVVAVSFSPLSSTLFTFERPVKSETDVHKNVKAWSVETGEEVGGWHQKTSDDWYVLLGMPQNERANDLGSQSSPLTRATYSGPQARIS
jgi:translation initiation factor 2A